MLFRGRTCPKTCRGRMTIEIEGEAHAAESRNFTRSRDVLPLIACPAVDE